MSDAKDQGSPPSRPMMSAVAEQLKHEQQRDMLVRAESERVALALQLGRRDVAMFCRAYGLTESEARKRMARVRRLGRRRCKCIEELDESRP